LAFEQMSASAQTEMYDEPFHVPEPDEVIFEERWASGEWFRSGAI
jgi:trehalose utilization protein